MQAGDQHNDGTCPERADTRRQRLAREVALTTTLRSPWIGAQLRTEKGCSVAVGRFYVLCPSSTGTLGVSQPASAQGKRGAGALWVR